METIKQINLVKLSTYINVFRSYFLKNNYFEQTLYSAIPYSVAGTESFKLVAGTESFKLKDDLFLRFFPEPEIWAAQEKSDRFFWIGSLFRNEERITRIHNYEFKIVDFYIKNSSLKEIVKVFFDLLRFTEKSLNLTELSKLKMIFITYDDFNSQKFDLNENYWLVVTNYPKDESFYDAISDDNNTTTKFEVMFVNSGKVVEIAAAGIIGENLNTTRYISGARNNFLEEIYDKKYIGLGFGIERLIYLYELKEFAAKEQNQL